MKKAIINADGDGETIMKLISKQSSRLHYSVSVNVSLSPFFDSIVSLLLGCWFHSNMRRFARFGTLFTVLKT